jgi:Uma2 family endonuclease
MASQPQPHFTTAEYLSLEREAEYKSQYLDGEIFAMSGASEDHNLVAGNVFASLHAQLRNRPCRVYINDLRVRDRASGLYTYPDVIAVCGERKFEDKQVLDTLLNPTLIVEVLSSSTENFDRGEKFRRYRTIESLMEYLLIAQDKCHIEHYTRQPDNQWLLSERQRLDDEILLSSINCRLLLSDVYENVNFEKQSEEKR